MIPSQLIASPGFVILFQWTALLALGWLAHGFLRQRHARWRLILWRSILGFSLVLPLFQLFHFPGIRIPVLRAGGAVDEFYNPTPPAIVVGPAPNTTPAAAPLSTAVVVKSPAHRAGPRPSILAKAGGWSGMLLMIWALGCVAGAARLIRCQLRLSHLRKETCQDAPDLEQLATQIRRRLDVRQPVAIQLSDAVTTPFVCGLWKPVIILPRTLAQLPPGEIAALLNHEMAHLRQHDLAWCIAWECLKTIAWFHPLVWKIPAAHNLACEQEADRIAAGQLAEPNSYARLLAQLALRVLEVPPVETKLTLNGSAQITRRLKYLDQLGGGTWSCRRSAIGFGLTTLFFLLIAVCKFSNAGPAKVDFKNVMVVVHDEDGQPIEGATITLDGFRVKGIHSADAYGWNPVLFGPAPTAVTDRAGAASLKYPVIGIPEEKEVTGKVFFTVRHPEFATVRLQSYAVDSPEKPVQMMRGIQLEVSGYFGSDHQPVTDLVPNVGRPAIRPDDWQKKAGGVFAFHRLAPGGHLLQLMGRLSTGELVYSEAFAFTAEKGKQYKFALELKPGIRLEGRLDDQVPRPVKNGRVLISVRPPEFPASLLPDEHYKLVEKYGGFFFWNSYRPIAEDGSFIFESIPAGEVDVIVHGDGFVSKSIGQIKLPIPGDRKSNTPTFWNPPAIGIPQPFALAAPLTKIEVVTEPTTTLEVTAKTKSGKPIAGVTVSVNPNIYRMQGGLFGQVNGSGEQPLRSLAPLPALLYSATTDKDGTALIPNVPATITHTMWLTHPQFQAPLDNGRARYVRVTLTPGATNHIEQIMEPKGADFIGSR